MTNQKLECKLIPQKCRFTLIWSHFDSSLASKCHFDLTPESKRLLKSRRHIRGVKMTLRIIVLKRLPLVKATLLNLQCMHSPFTIKVACAILSRVFLT